jgi:hypothetical protein
MVSMTRGAVEVMVRFSPVGKETRALRPNGRGDTNAGPRKRASWIWRGEGARGDSPPAVVLQAAPHQRRSIERWPVARFAPLKYVTDGENACISLYEDFSVP